MILDAQKDAHLHVPTDNELIKLQLNNLADSGFFLGSTIFHLTLGAMTAVQKMLAKVDILLETRTIQAGATTPLVNRLHPPVANTL